MTRAHRGFPACPFCGNCDEIVMTSTKLHGVCRLHRVWWTIGNTPNVNRKELADKGRATIAPYTEVTPTLGSADWERSMVWLENGAAPMDGPG